METIISLDLETTGTDPAKDRIIEIGLVAKMSDGQVSVGAVAITDRYLVNPGVVISEDMTSIHGIKNEDVVGKPPFSEIAPVLARALRNCILTGYNVSGYDVPLLANEFKRCGITWPDNTVTVVDALAIMRAREPRNLAWALRYYCFGKELVGAHSAVADAEAAMMVLEAQGLRYIGPGYTKEQLVALQRDPNWVDSTGKFRYLPNKSIVCSFGKHSGRPISELPADYLRWIYGNNFPDDCKLVVKNELDRRRRSCEKLSQDIRANQK